MLLRLYGTLQLLLFRFNTSSSSVMRVINANSRRDVKSIFSSLINSFSAEAPQTSRGHNEWAEKLNDFKTEHYSSMRREKVGKSRETLTDRKQIKKRHFDKTTRKNERIFIIKKQSSVSVTELNYCSSSKISNKNIS